MYLIDGTYELFRAHFSKRPGHRAPGGWDAKATVGVVASLLALLRHADEEVTHLAVAFDNPIRSFRNDLFAGWVPRGRFEAWCDAMDVRTLKSRPTRWAPEE
ncbi:hypothetical protein BE20_44470 [Sorangium cellulosum]|nr:hypothetical protein BE20_44470 [Sorangium cellulosum]